MIKKRIDREKKLIVGLAILILIVYGLTFGIKAIEKSHSKETQSYIDAVQLTFSPSEIRVTDDEEPYSLAKSDDGWTYEDDSNLRISRWKVNFMITALKEVIPERIISNGREHFSEFGLDNPQIEISLLNGEQKVTYKFGNYNTALKEYYMSLDDSNYVYLINFEDMKMIYRQLLELVEGPTIVGTSVSDINVIEVDSSKSYTAVRKGNEFEISYGEKKITGSEYKVSRIYEAFNSASYKCVYSSYSENSIKNCGLDKPEAVVYIVTAANSKFKLSVGLGSDGNHYVMENDNGIIYSVDETSYSNLMEYISLSDFGL